MNTDIPNCDALVNTVIKLARDPAHLDIVNLRGQTALHVAVCVQRPTVIARLIDAGASVSVREALHGDTPLLLACRLGHADCLQAIVEALKRREDLDAVRRAFLVADYHGTRFIIL